MDGAHGVFSVLPGNLPDGEEVRVGRMIGDMAAEIGIAHLVYSSGASVGTELTGVPRVDAKPQIEAHVRSLPVTATIVRPMIFMDMLLGPNYGLDQGRYTFFLKPDQEMQLVAVDDIGAFVAVIFANKLQSAGRTVKLASDTVSGFDLQTILSEAADQPIRYEQFPQAALAASPDLAHMSRSLDNGPLSDHVDLAEMRAISPDLTSFRAWIATSGRKTLPIVSPRQISQHLRSNAETRYVLLAVLFSHLAEICQA
ncbi:MAG: hypothetical protein TREMPRED_005943 [Tremellales sp. Tagirdzhanova-0007]|nr:MAG: hypothetical protein TREMPRED_005943 [Tremellales sp. Tagirdzhanova-0007]